MSTHKDWSFLTTEILMELYSRLGNWAEVERHLGIEKTVLLAVRKRLGMTIGVRPPHDRRKWKTGRLHSQTALILGLAQSGLNCGEIAREIGEPDPENVRELLVRNGVDRQRAGAPRGDKNPMWKGGRVIDQDGYILVKVNGHPQSDRHGYVREHRLVMEQKLGRYLSTSEVVHHIDGDRQNNDPDNLELFADNGRHLALEWEDPEWAEHQAGLRRGVYRGRRTRSGLETDAQE